MRVQAGLPDAWGVRPDDLERTFPCDAHLPDADRALLRAVDVDAPPEIAFRWLCQLRLAPYSYDWIDNWGRRSPPTLTEGVDALEVGQQFMSIFELVEFEVGRHVTVRITEPRANAAFGEVVCSYVVDAVASDRCRIVCKLLVRYPGGVPGRIGRATLPTGDLVMMRKQLLNLKRYAERTARAVRSERH